MSIHKTWLTALHCSQYMHKSSWPYL